MISMDSFIPSSQNQLINSPSIYLPGLKFNQGISSCAAFLIVLGRTASAAVDLILMWVLMSIHAYRQVENNIRLYFNPIGKISEKHFLIIIVCHHYN